MKFKDVEGHELIISDLLKMLDEDKINQAMLFDGIDGVGKKYLSEIFIKTIFCKNRSDDACGICEKCIQFDNGTNPDYLFISNEDTAIKKEDIKQLIDFLSIKPYESKYKIVLVENFHTATPEAQNSLLKTLEEMPDYGIVILLSENKQKILDTILSRAKLYKFQPIQSSKILSYLVKNYNLEYENAKFISDFSNGSIGNAIKIVENKDFREIRREALYIFDKILKGEKSYFISNISFFSNQKDNMNAIIDLYLLWLRDLIIMKNTYDTKIIYNRDLAEMLVSENYLDYEFIYNTKDRLLELKKNIESNINDEFAVELCFIDILEDCN